MTNHLHAITFDCHDVKRVSEFWSRVLGRPLDDGANDQFAVIGLAENTKPIWLFMHVDGDRTVHPDIATGDLDAETDRLVGLGATTLEHFDIPNVTRYTQFTDPEGNRFDVAAQ